MYDANSSYYSSPQTGPVDLAQRSRRGVSGGMSGGGQLGQRGSSENCTQAWVCCLQVQRTGPVVLEDSGILIWSHHTQLTIPVKQSTSVPGVRRTK